MVPMEGVEPTHPFGYQILSPAVAQHLALDEAVRPEHRRHEEPGLRTDRVEVRDVAHQQQFLDLMNQLVTGSYLKQQGQLLMLQEYVPPKLDCRYLCFLSEHHLHKKPTYTMEVVVSQFSHKY